jgi:hypothetical protein
MDADGDTITVTTSQLLRDAILRCRMGGEKVLKMTAEPNVVPPKDDADLLGAVG